MTSTAQELHPPPTLEPGRTILELRGLEKRYPGTHALKPVNLAFKAAEIHDGLLGDVAGEGQVQRAEDRLGNWPVAHERRRWERLGSIGQGDVVSGEDQLVAHRRGA